MVRRIVIRGTAKGTVSFDSATTKKLRVDLNIDENDELLVVDKCMFITADQDETATDESIQFELYDLKDQTL